uniref:VWFA domain-containing protein n=1 Tax=Callorhinchus milii TaxID=7868 RepID=A0A4W3JV54_CALMI
MLFSWLMDQKEMRSSFPSVQSFISRVVEKLDVGSDKVRVSVVQYSDDPRPEFLLNSHSNKQDVMDAIRRLRVKGGRQTNTGEALSYVTKSVFTINGGSRIQEGVPQFLILLTAGKSTDDVRRAALALKHTGVAPFTIGSRDADDEELRQISLSPDYVFRVDDLRNVGTLEQRLESPLSTLTRDQVVQIQRRILEGKEALSVDDRNSFDRNIPSAYSSDLDTAQGTWVLDTVNAEQESISVCVPGAVKRDVVFLVDGSEKMRSSFPSVQSFISRVVEKLDVGSDKVRVSVVQYSDDPRPEFLLNSHSNKQDVMDAIRRLRVKGGRQTNTGEALSYVTKSVFTINGGSRIQEGVPQFLILLTAGKSTDDVRRAALALKHTGVAPFTIGSRDADDEELRQISLSPDYVFRVDDLRNVGTLEQRLESPLSTLTRDQVVQIQRRILEGKEALSVEYPIESYY